METTKQFVDELNKKIHSAMDEGDVFKVNEITANIMLGAVITMMMILCGICLLLNELGIFTADKIVMRSTIVTSLIVEIPILTYNKKLHGEGKNLRAILEWGLLAICTFMCGALGHNVTLLMAIPALLSIRYCDVNFSRKIVFSSIVLFGVASIVNAYFGILNLNMYKVAPGTVLTVETSLRQAIIDSGIDTRAYLKSLLINDYLPKLMVFSVIGFSVIKIAERARNMAEMQNEISKKSSRIETELNLANEIQAGMLPCIFPAFPDHGELKLYASNTPAKEVGGDFYDYFKIDEDHVAIVMADVSGKGVGAALFMTISKIVLKNQLVSQKSTSLAMTSTNAQLCENNEADLFVTCWVGIYEISTGTLRYTNGGHNPPIICQANGHCEYLKGINGLCLAALGETEYTESVVKLQKGDEIFLYTDGVTEATNKDLELYGEDRLMDYISKHTEDDVHAQVDGLLANINEFIDGAEQFDDITMMGMKIE